jgi:UTP--glucose-1-phosphate uridylyltransferase
MSTFRKAVIPVAGKGTRFLPITKEIPKEMLPLLDLPIIYYVVEEAIKAGIEHIIFVTAEGKEQIENFFDRNYTLEAFLEKSGKIAELEKIKKIGEMIEFSSVRQKEQKGLGHAVACAKALVGKDNFCVLLGDDLISSKKPVTAQLIEQSLKYNSPNTIAVMKVPDEDVKKYGIIIGENDKNDNRVTFMKEMIEKPKPQDVKSRLATPGRYTFDGEIFDYLKKIKPGSGGEYQLTDAINLLSRDRKVIAYEFEGNRHDTGNLNSYLEAVVHYALERSDTKDVMKAIIKKYS